MTRLLLYLVSAVVVIHTSVDLCQAEGRHVPATMRISLPGDQPMKRVDATGKKDTSTNETERALADKARALKSLVQPRIDLSKAPDAPVNSVALEPWAPGRGALGIRVEVTW
jgi:hypothetical protein